MTRALLLVLAVLTLIVLLVALSGDAGRAEVTWFHWNVRATAAAVALFAIFVTLAASLFWRGLIWIAEAPRRSARARAETRRRQGADALTRGFLAVAGGDGAEARRQAQRAAGLVDDTPGLVRLLSAQAAEAAGDGAAAKTAYETMLGFPELRMAGHRGLMLTAQAEGDDAKAQSHAEAAYGLARTAPWAWRAVLEAKLADGDWDAGLDLMKGALERKIVSPLTAERARAALLTARAASREHDPDERLRQSALDDAQAAAKLRPDFAPASVIAARLFAADGRASRAAQLIEAAWKQAPHPALWLTYRDLRTDETPRERATRLSSLAAFSPAARESHILAAEQALVTGDAPGASAALAALGPEPLTRRLAGLRARIANASGDRDEGRAWIARGAAAPQEPDWSDLDPQGRAFAYAPADWARLVQAYAERGELAHPRFERGERGLSDLPELPAVYADSAPFIGAAAEPGLPAIVDDADFSADLAPADAEGDDAPPAPNQAGRAPGMRPKGR
ncbi:MAG TPA: heme biosynthesis HemY N-terminal domain-containing protein [Caulobacteraceae bacterium]|nr:heme biosynthesis HemY N-terminal domain-containing protein [Caulobacteraceae bacterium]